MKKKSITEFLSFLFSNKNVSSSEIKNFEGLVRGVDVRGSKVSKYFRDISSKTQSTLTELVTTVESNINVDNIADDAAIFSDYVIYPRIRSIFSGMDKRTSILIGNLSTENTKASYRYINSSEDHVVKQDLHDLTYGKNDMESLVGLSLTACMLQNSIQGNYNFDIHHRSLYTKSMFPFKRPLHSGHKLLFPKNNNILTLTESKLNTLHDNSFFINDTLMNEIYNFALEKYSYDLHMHYMEEAIIYYNTPNPTRLMVADRFANGLRLYSQQIINNSGLRICGNSKIKIGTCSEGVEHDIELIRKVPIPQQLENLQITSKSLFTAHVDCPNINMRIADLSNLNFNDRIAVISAVRRNFEDRQRAADVSMRLCKELSKEDLEKYSLILIKPQRDIRLFGEAISSIESDNINVS